MGEEHRIAEKEFGEIKDLEEIEGGLMNHTFSVRTREGDYILQVTSETEPHELENCLRSFVFMSGDVPVPEPYTDGVRSLEDQHYIIVEKLEGGTLEPDTETTRESGRILARIHGSKKFDSAGWIDWEDGEPVVQGFPGDSLRRRVEQVLEDWREFFESLDADWLVDAADTALDNLETVPEEFPAVFVHHDFNPGNILEEDGEIKAVLDFDYAHSGHATRDLAKAANKFWLRGGEREDLYSGYREVREPELFEETLDFYLLETFLDEIAGMMDLDHMTLEEAGDYRDEVERLADRIG